MSTSRGTVALDRTDPAPHSGSPAFAALSARERLLLAAMECVGQWGVTKTTVDDVARVAGCGRATVYRLFPDGKPELFRSAAQANISRLLHQLGEELRSAESLEELAVSGVHGAATLSAESPAFQYLLEHEPHVAAPHLSFQRLELLLATARVVIGPLVQRFVDPVAADRLVELVARVVVSYTFLPEPGLDLTDLATARRVTRRYILDPLAASLDPSERSTVPSLDQPTT
jgi:AcrR family transcriptional regulator